MTLLRAYRDLYLDLVDWGLRAHGPQDLPRYNALLGLSLVGTMNVFSTIMLGEMALGERHVVPHAGAVALLVWVGLLVLHSVLLSPSARADRGAREGRARPGWRMWLYPAVSFLVFLSILSARASG